MGSEKSPAATAAFASAAEADRRIAGVAVAEPTVEALPGEGAGEIQLLIQLFRISVHGAAHRRARADRLADYAGVGTIWIIYVAASLALPGPGFRSAA